MKVFDGIRDFNIRRIGDKVVERVTVTLADEEVVYENVVGGFPKHLPGVVPGEFLGFVDGGKDRTCEVMAVTPGEPTEDDPLRGVMIVMRSRDGERVVRSVEDLGVWEIEPGWPDDFAFDPSDDECELCGFPRFDCKCDGYEEENEYP